MREMGLMTAEAETITHQPFLLGVITPTLMVAQHHSPIY